MKNYNQLYKQYENDRKKISSALIERGNFYLLKGYVNVEGRKIAYSEIEAPIIYVLFTSKPKDEIHAIKLTNTNPVQVKKLFKQLVNEDKNEIELKGSSKKIYNNSLKKLPNVTNQTYRTYKWSGIKSIYLVNMEEEAFLPKSITNKNKK